MSVDCSSDELVASYKGHDYRGNRLQGTGNRKDKSKSNSINRESEKIARIAINAKIARIENQATPKEQKEQAPGKAKTQEQKQNQLAASEREQTRIRKDCQNCHKCQNCQN